MDIDESWELFGIPTAAEESSSTTEFDLKSVVESHKLWIETNRREGERADLSFADLSNADLSFADLSFADLSFADLSEATLIGANLYRVVGYSP